MAKPGQPRRPALVGPSGWHAGGSWGVVPPGLTSQLGQGQAEIAAGVGPEPYHPHPGGRELGFDVLAAELGRDLGAQLFPGRETDRQAEISDRDLLLAR